MAKGHPLLYFCKACLTEDEYRSIYKRFPSAGRWIKENSSRRGPYFIVDLIDADSSVELIGEDGLKEIHLHNTWYLDKTSYKKLTLETWQNYLYEKSKESQPVIFDSALFQYQIFGMLLFNADGFEI
ncbi:hypothetical protein [Peribacillus deserti]|uniref:Uncharacterized protein n=1 Tax=Peribacillus deserti TaxID=673318 RepID=A0A2N5MAZ0_9BACI|nr:hypothetical protein [Peribacillus deserti]PLT31514.1 hypothetical protein CUU66_02150 [Peribacillus deserti]